MLNKLIAVLMAVVLLSVVPLSSHTGLAAKNQKEDDALPLTPARTVSFTTDEATWMSLDVSPDGKTIIFDLLGDLYTLPINGGNATRLTHGPAFDSQPRFSPDGKLIAFTSDRDGAENLWIMDSTGGYPRKLSQERQTMFASPAWLPDGDYAIVSRNTGLAGHWDLWVYHRDGGAGSSLTAQSDSPANREFLGPTASRDGRFIYYSVMPADATWRDVIFPISQIARLDRRTGEVETLTAAQGSAIRPCISPDGRLLVYGTREDRETSLRIRNLETGEERWLIHSVERDQQETGALSRDLLPGYAFTPDGSAVIVSSGGKIHRVDVATGRSQVIPFIAHVEQQIGPSLVTEFQVETGPVKLRRVCWPSFSPDGSRLIFSAFNRVWTMAVPGGKPTRLTDWDVSELMPAWSPDGQWIAFVTWNNEGGHLWKVHADGGVPVRLTRKPGFYTGPVWSRDGRRIVFIAGSWERRLERQDVDPLDLVWVSSDGDAEMKRIASARGRGRPYFAKESERVYLLAGHRVSSLDIEGGDERVEVGKVTDAGGRTPWETILSPGGDRLLIKDFKEDVYVAPLPPRGVGLPSLSLTNPSVPLRKLSELGGSEFVTWSHDGQMATWSVGSVVFRMAVDAPAGTKPEAIPVPIEMPRAEPQGSLLLRGARIITMKGEEVIDRGDILVVKNRIAAVGRQGQVQMPPGTKVMDVSGRTIMPGLIDVHSHFDYFHEYPMPERQSWPYLAALAYGVTTVRDPQSITTNVFTNMDLVEIGEILGPRIYTTGPGLPSSSNLLTTQEDAETVARRYQEYYRTHMLKDRGPGNRQQRQWLLMAARKYRMMPTVEGAQDMELNLTCILDGYAGTEHNFPVAPLYKDVTELAARSGIYYTPTLLVMYGGPRPETYFYQTINIHDDPKIRRFFPHAEIDRRTRRHREWVMPEEQVFPLYAKVADAVVRAGGRVCLGAHGELQGLGSHWELWAIQSGGMSRHNALRVGTIFGAEALGLARELGSLEAGKLADLIVLDGNPLEEIRNTVKIRYVMKNGELFEGDTLDRVWPSAKKLQPLHLRENDH